jgi:hypothetical protein
MDLDKHNLANLAAKRALDMSNVPEKDKVTGYEEVNGNGITHMITDGETVLVNEEVNNEKDRTKRTKKDGAVSPSIGSAGSREDSVRSQ